MSKNKDTELPFMFAAIEGHKSVVEQLLAKGADVNAGDNEGNTAWSLPPSEATRLLLIC